MSEASACIVEARPSRPSGETLDPATSSRSNVRDHMGALNEVQLGKLAERDH